MGGRGRNFLVYGLILIVLIVVVYAILGRGGGSSQTVPLAGGGEDLLSLIERDLGQIESIRVSPNQVTLDYRDNGGSTSANTPSQPWDVFEFFSSHGVDITSQGFPEVVVRGSGGFGSVVGGLLINFLPFILIFGIIFFFLFRHAQGQGSQAMSFGKSKARLVTANRPNVTFNDVAGADEAKQELQEVVEFLKFPERFRVARSADSARRAARRPARYGQDAVGPRGRR